MLTKDGDGGVPVNFDDVDAFDYIKSNNKKKDKQTKTHTPIIIATLFDFLGALTAWFTFIYIM